MEAAINMDPAEIKTLRESLGYTQEQLADAIGVNRTAVTLWETGRRNPSGAAGKMLGILMGMASPLRQNGAKKQKKSGR